MKALVLAPFDSAALERLGQSMEVAYESWIDTRKLLSPEEFVERIQREDIGILVVEADFLPREVFEKADKLKMVGVCRADASHIDMEAATEYGVPVVNTPARNAIAVAELTVGLMLSLIRKIPDAHNMVRSRQWVDPTGAYFTLRGTELTGKTVGIVGFGAIGRLVARLLQAFDTSIIVYDPFLPGEKVRERGAEPVELDDLMSRSDIITLHCSVTPESMGLLDARRIALMKPTACLVNAASTFVIDNEAVIGALREKRIAGAAFDVYETWPVRPDSPLLELDNVVLTPHIGGATAETLVRYSGWIVDDVERFLRGERPVNLLNPQVWEKHGG